MSAAEVQSLLRFLTQDAKVPLATAIASVKPLQQASLATIDGIAKSKIDDIQKIFPDAKQSKQVSNAAKRVSKKRAAGDDDDAPASARKKRNAGSSSSSSSIFSLHQEQTPAELEASLRLPSSDCSPEHLDDVVVFTNRAPLVLAFIVVLLKYTMPEQPLSSRLSLAQAYVSVTSRARAVDLGIESGQSAEQLGVGIGQATVTIMGKELRVLKRWGYEWTDEHVATDAKVEDGEGEQKIKVEETDQLADEQHDEECGEGEEEDDHHHQQQQQQQQQHPPLWGLDLEALKALNATDPPPSTHTKPHPASRDGTTTLPIHTPQSARAYLLKSFASPPTSTSPNQPPTTTKKPSTLASTAEKERNLGLLLRALDLLYQSWMPVLGPDDMDARVWGWYVRVRPAVEQGRAGWGGKNEVRLGEILALRRGG